MDENDNKNQWMKTYARYSGLGLQLLMSILLGFFLGQQVDKWLGLETPWFTILFIFIFFLASMFYLVKSLFKK